jgi:hypothetical protein
VSLCDTPNLSADPQSPQGRRFLSLPSSFKGSHARTAKRRGDVLCPMERGMKNLPHQDEIIYSDSETVNLSLSHSQSQTRGRERVHGPATALLGRPVDYVIPTNTVMI